MLGGPHQRWLLDADHGCIFEKCFLVLCRVLLNAHSIARGVADNLVVHVRDVHDVMHFVAALPQEPLQHVDGDESSEVADMAVVVDGWAAGIHADFVVAKRTEFLDLRGHGVVKA